MTPNIVALVPAHNEEASVGQTVRALLEQTIQPTRILVISDNSTDRTVDVAREAGAEVMETVGNTSKKAGALNQGLSRIPRHGYVLVVDADTLLDPDFIYTAFREMNDPRVGGVGAIFKASEPSGLLELFQYLEWERYAEETDRTGKTFVMSGTAALIRWEALESVRERFGHWYDEKTITEDSRLSIDLKLAGWELRSPLGCATITETMPTIPDLFRQRRRWYLGALQNVRDTGMNRITWPYWRQQILLGACVVLMWLYLTLTAVAAVTHGLSITPWLLVGAIFMVERVITIWDQPVRRRIFAALLIPELFYALLLQMSYLAAVWQFVTRQQGSWHHITERNTHVLT